MRATPEVPTLKPWLHSQRVAQKSARQKPGTFRAWSPFLKAMALLCAFEVVLVAVGLSILAIAMRGR